jgi:hypothetical protein
MVDCTSLSRYSISDSDIEGVQIGFPKIEI